MNTKSIAMWVILRNNADWDFQDFDFAGDLEDSKSTSGASHCSFFGSHAFVPKSWMCKKNCCFSQLHRIRNHLFGRWIEFRWVACSRIMGSDFSLLGNMTQTTERQGRPVDTERSQNSQGKINVLKNIDSVPSNVQFPHQKDLLYVSEDNEAVIKMIIKGRSPTMRHVSRTHTQLHLIGCSIESTWTQKPKLSTSTPKIKLLIS